MFWWFGAHVGHEGIGQAEIRRGPDADHAGHRARGLNLDVKAFPARHQPPAEGQVHESRPLAVGDEPTPAGDQRYILATTHRLPDVLRHHCTSYNQP